MCVSKCSGETHLREKITSSKHWDIHCMFSKSSHGFGTRCLDLDCLGWFLMAGWWSWGVNSQFFHHGLNGRTRLNQSVAWFFLRGRKTRLKLRGFQIQCSPETWADSIFSCNGDRAYPAIVADENQLWTKPTRSPFGCLCSWKCCCSSRTILWSYTTHGAWYL